MTEKPAEKRNKLIDVNLIERRVWIVKFLQIW